MKRYYYPRLAFDGIRKNKQMYVPYLLTCIGMVMIYYIMAFLKSSEIIFNMRGGRSIQAYLNLGSWVILIFACIFLFYTNSFLIKRRMKEFGLYNILGMQKKNIARILLWESIGIYVVSLGLGLLFGIAFSKLFELGLVNLLKGKVDDTLSLSLHAILASMAGFLVIFFLLYLNTLRRIHFSTAISLLKTENTGEKAPKGNLLIALLGLMLLGGAYYIAVTIKEPLAAVMLFFVAVIMVIVATYMLMISGSVVLCRLLRKNKRYYYKPQHFVSVSSMAYRMKRNGAGLASICILATMVLVMLSSTASLFLGQEDSLRNRYPRELVGKFTMENMEAVSKENCAKLYAKLDEACSESGAEKRNFFGYRRAAVTVLFQGDFMNTDPELTGDFSLEGLKNITNVFFVGLEDYNAVTGDTRVLGENEVLLYEERMDYPEKTVTFPNHVTYQVKEKVDRFMDRNVAGELVIPTLIVIVPDFDEDIGPLVDAYGRYSDHTKYEPVSVSWNYGFDTGLTTEQQIELNETIYEKFLGPEGESEFGIYYFSVDAREGERADFYSIYGGLFFLGIVLSVVFLTAAVLIIYYKQISEGFEDYARFEIMQKVGMTKKEIRKSINSQLLTVFFLPLLGAGIHMLFAFQIIDRILLLFELNNTLLFAGVCLLCFVVFGVFYAVVYRRTSKVYYNIVSGGRE